MLLNDSNPEYWKELASHDFISAKILDREKGPKDVIVYHYQQCIEKLLKAKITLLKQNLPRIHDLERLFAIVKTDKLEIITEPIIILNSISQNTRYPQGEFIDDEKFFAAKKAFSSIIEIIAPDYS